MAMATTTLGLREQLVFPEIDYDKIDKLRGLEVCIVTTARTDAEGAHFSPGSGCLQEELTDGKEVPDRQGEPARPVLHAGTPPLRCVRSFACLHAQVRHVPHLFPPTRQHRTDTWRSEELVVTHDQ